MGSLFRPHPGAARCHVGQPKLIRGIGAVEWENVRLCSPMFAYVRLMGEKMLRALRAAAMRIGGKRAGFKFLTVRHLISHCTGIGYGNSAVRIQILCGSQSNGLREDASTFRSRATSEDGRPPKVRTRLPCRSRSDATKLDLV